MHGAYMHITTHALAYVNIYCQLLLFLRRTGAQAGSDPALFITYLCVP